MPRRDVESGKPAQPHVDLSDPSTPPPAVHPKRGQRGDPETLGDATIYAGERFTLGMKLASSIWGQSGSSYFLVSRGSFARPAERRFPLTEKGWKRMWQTFASEDPHGALACKRELHERGAHAPTGTDAAAVSTQQRAQSEAVPGRDPLDCLERLAELHRQGALTDDEFEAAKRGLLRQL